MPKEEEHKLTPKQLRFLFGPAGPFHKHAKFRLKYLNDSPAGTVEAVASPAAANRLGMGHDAAAWTLDRQWMEKSRRENAAWRNPLRKANGATSFILYRPGEEKTTTRRHEQIHAFQNSLKARRQPPNQVPLDTLGLSNRQLRRYGLKNPHAEAPAYYFEDMKRERQWQAAARYADAMEERYGTRTAENFRNLIGFHPQVPKGATGNRVFVSLQDKTATIVDPSGRRVKSFKVFVGSAKYPTPTGQFRILENTNPIKAGENVYGPRWIGFAKGYDNGNPPSYAGFHGWTHSSVDDEVESQSPGWKTSTEGCVQLQNKDMAEFAKHVGSGDKVIVLPGSVRGKRKL